MNLKIRYNKLFPLPPTNTYNNLCIDEEAVTFVTTPAISETIGAIINSHIPDSVSRSDITILDGTACVGGDSITFGKMFGTVISTEIDRRRYKMLKNNLAEYNLRNVIPINDDCVKICGRLNYVDILYLDPPWGGKQYKLSANLRLTLGNKFIDDIIKNILDQSNNPKKSSIKLIALKLPKNYDLYSLYKKIKNYNIEIYLHELHKMNIIIINKINSWI